MDVLIPAQSIGPEAAAQSAARQAAERLYEQVAPAVVTVETEKNRGTGFFVGKDGIVLSAAHVVLEASEIVVTTADQKRYRARIVDLGDTTDLVKLRLQGFDHSKQPSLELAASGAPAAGAAAFAVGMAKATEKNISSGSIVGEVVPYSLVNKDAVAARYAKESRKSKDDWLEALSAKVTKANLHIEHGDSGGPLIDSDGRVIGVTMMREDGGRGVSYYRPISDISSLLERKRNKFEFHYLEHAPIFRKLSCADTKEPQPRLADSTPYAVPGYELPALTLVGAPAPEPSWLDKLFSSRNRSTLQGITRTDGDLRPPFHWSWVDLTGTVGR